MGGEEEAWSGAVFAALKAHHVRQFAYVPDAGLSDLINLAQADNDITCTSLTTEEEGVALVCGAHLGGQNAVLAMQSSGVGNCVNMLSLIANCRFPLLTLVTMRGEWGEFNPWQVAMGRATPDAFQAMGVEVRRVDRTDEAGETVEAAATMAFQGGQAMAVLFSQRMIARKSWTK